MKKNRIIIALVIFWVGSFSLLHAQAIDLTLTNKLTDFGFENVQIVCSEGEYWISYESNLYVWNVTELKAAMDLVSDYLKDEKVSMVTLREENPVLITSFRTSDWTAFRKGKITNEEIDSKMTIKRTDSRAFTLFEGKKSNSNRNKIDFVIFPDFKFRNVRLDRVYDVALNISPTVEFSLWKGNKFTAQVIVPIVNEDYGYLYKKVRPGFVTVSQQLVFPQSWHVSLTAGNFNTFRWGGDLDVYHYFGKDQWKIGINAGLTGPSYFDGFSAWYVDPPKTVSVVGRLGYYYKPLQAEVILSGGRYFTENWGARMDVCRHMRSVTVGLFAQVANSDYNAGFNFALPLNIPSKYKRNNVRVRAPRYFDMEYIYSSEDNRLDYYETRPNENRSEQFFNPHYIKEELQK